MELLQLKYFCDAAESQNFSKTARKFLVPTSNISQSIKRLEKELDCQLFDHKSNKITLNSAGKDFYKDVSKALELLETSKSRLSNQNGYVHGEICLACLTNRRIVTNVIQQFIKKYPNVNFNIHHNIEPNIDFDIIISDTYPHKYSDKILLIDEAISIAMQSNNHLADKDTVSIQDLSSERFITMTPSSSMYKITLSACIDAGIEPDIAIQIDDPFYVRKYVEMGLGIALVPTTSWQGLFPKNVILKEIEGIRRRTYAFIPKNSNKKLSVEMFLKYLTDYKAERADI